MEINKTRMFFYYNWLHFVDVNSISLIISLKSALSIISMSEASIMC
jgi:hypothetical protein